MAKKAKSKKTKAAKAPELKAVEGGAEPKQTAEPKDYVEQGLKFVNDAFAAFELAMAHLNDPKAGEYYKTIQPDDFRKVRMKAVGEYSRKAAFALTSLRDEVMLCLQIKGVDEVERAQAEAQASDAPVFTVSVPEVDLKTAVALGDQHVTIADLEKTEKHYDMTVAMLAETQIAAYQYERAGVVLNFQIGIRDKLRAAIAAAKKSLT